MERELIYQFGNTDITAQDTEDLLEETLSSLSCWLGKWCRIELLRLGGCNCSVCALVLQGGK